MLSPSIRAVLVSTALLLLLTPAVGSGPAEAPTVPRNGPAIDEQAEARLVQVDVSVIDPKSKSFRSVPGLKAEQFMLKLDGRPLSAEEQAALRFDAICDAAGDGMARPILVIVDFNYVDARGRAKVADAIDGIADGAAARPEVYKVYALTRQVRELTPGFTRDPARLHEAAAAIRAVAFRGDETLSELASLLTNDDLPALLGAGSGRGGSLGAMPAGVALQAETIDGTLAGAAPLTGVGLYSPQRTLAALDGVLLAHTHLPGRKAAVLFSSPRFRFPPAEDWKLERSLRPVLDLAQQGFAIWTVDVEGLSIDGGGSSDILSSLALDSGGRAVRNVSDMSVPLIGSAEQLACYYLFSLPIPPGGPSARHSLTVKLDTERYKDLWGLRVMAPSRITLETRAERLMRKRVAALLAPDDFAQPPVAVMLDYPSEAQGKDVLLTRFRVPLSDLAWIPEGDGSYCARLLLDTVVQRDNGAALETVCQTAGETLGEVALRLPEIPASDPRAGFTIELPCVYRKDGVYVARGVVTDLEVESVGAGRSTVMFRKGGRDQWTAMAARVEAASGLDLVWRPGMTVAKRESGRSAFRLVDDQRPAYNGDRISLSYVLCGPDRAAAVSNVRHLLVAIGADGARPFQVLPTALTWAEPEGSGSFCSQVRVAIPEFTLAEGRYAFAVVDTQADTAAVAATVGMGGAAGAAEPAPPAGLLASTGFRVAP